MSRSFDPMRRLFRAAAAPAIMFAAFIAVGASAAAAQRPDSAIFARAKQLVVSGNGAAGRLLVDSVLSATAEGSPAYAEALYWRAALAANSAEAERDYRRIAVEYPLSPHSGEALFQLAQLEAARGDRAAATTHLQRFLAENPSSAERGKASLTLVRLLFEQNDLLRGCSTLRQAQREIPSTAVETRNQLDYYAPRCVATDAGPGGRMPMPPAQKLVPPPDDSAKRDSAHAAKEPKSAKGLKATKEPTERTETTERKATSEGRYTLQVAAYKAKADAEGLVKRLKARKLDARVVATTKLYRVRIGHYKTHSAAVEAQQELKRKKITTIVTDTDDEGQ